MTEKEKKEIFGNIEPNFNTNLANGTITINLDYWNCLEEYIRRILDELEQKDKEIQELKEKWNKDTHTLQNQLDSANADRVEKDKIIDLIYNTFYEFGCKFSGSFMKFLSKKGFNEDCEKCDYETCDCKECIKRYLKKKAREENES